MGGIVIKKAFLLARQDLIYHSLASRFHCMFFLATPHRGADIAQTLSNIIRLSISHGTKAYIKDLIPNSRMIQTINDAFRHQYSDLHLWSFFETVPTTMGLIVEKDSAVLGLPGERAQLLNANHHNVCKFDDPSDKNYYTLRNAFVSTIDSIEKTCLSYQRDEHHAEMRLLSRYLGIAEKPVTDLTSVLEKKVKGTCEWIIESPAFLEWRDANEGVPKCFWLNGAPATGKSTIAGFVTKYLEENKCDCTYFFFKDGASRRSTVSEMLRSLAWQMALINTDVRQTLLEMERGGESIDRTDARPIWRMIFATRIFHIELPQPCYWVIDAVDECSSYPTLFSLLAEINPNFPLSIFLTSRPSLSIDRLFSQENIAIISNSVTTEKVREDIRLFLQMSAQYLPVDEDFEREELVQRIVDKSNGNFLWASLVLKRMMMIHSKQQIYDVLMSVTEEMEGLDGPILPRMSAEPRNKELARPILRRTICATQPLMDEELQEGLILDNDEPLS